MLINWFCGKLSKSLPPSPGTIGTIQASTRSQETDSMRCCFSRVNAFKPPRPWGPWLLSLPRPAPNSLTMEGSWRQVQILCKIQVISEESLITSLQETVLDCYGSLSSRASTPLKSKNSGMPTLWTQRTKAIRLALQLRIPSGATKLGIANSPQ